MEFFTIKKYNNTMKGFTKEENFDQNEVGAAFINLAQVGTTAKDDNGDFYEFIRENADLFPGLDTSNQDAMKHANLLCKITWGQFETEIEENYNK